MGGDEQSGEPQPAGASFRGRVVLVPSPIGNLADITLRALETLKEADVVACEDTRHSSRLLHHYGIHKPLVSFHEHNEASRSEELANRAAEGELVACLSDAGMPGISDPGQRLIQRCLAQGVPHEVLPGASAVLTGLIGSGLPADQFYYGGFLPHKKGQKTRELTAALEREYSSVFFESPHRILTTLGMMAELAPGRLLCVARELSKKFETFHRGTAATVQAEFAAKPSVKGEITLIVAGTKLPKWLYVPPDA